MGRTAVSWWRRVRDRRRAAKVKPGDGSALKPYRWWQPLTRSLFTIELADQDARTAYAVDVHFFDTDDYGDTVALLYRDGVQEATSTTPAAFPVPGGRIEVQATMFGLKRMHYVRDGDAPASPTADQGRVLTPHPRSAEGLRARLAARHPLASQVIAGAAIAVLLVSLVVAVPAFVELVTQWDVLADHADPYTSPFDLPGWASTALLTASIVAAIERAITLRNHWLVDADTSWLS